VRVQAKVGVAGALCGEDAVVALLERTLDRSVLGAIGALEQACRCSPRAHALPIPCPPHLRHTGIHAP
jgi:hypothetical protein